MVEREWFANWPEQVLDLDATPDQAIDHTVELGALLAARKKRLKEWFNNHVKATRRAPKLKNLAIQLNPKATRGPQAVEVYSKKYYKDKVQTAVKAEIADGGIDPKQSLAVIKRKTKAAFDNEPEVVRRAVFAEASAAKKAGKAGSTTSPTPESYAAAIECIPDIIYQFTQSMEAQTGWIWTVMCGGPDPMNGGRIHTMEFHHDENALKHSFMGLHIAYEENVAKPYAAFVKTVFSPDICAARALSSITNRAVIGVQEVSAVDTVEFMRSESAGLSVIDPALLSPILTPTTSTTTNVLAPPTDMTIVSTNSSTAPTDDVAPPLPTPQQPPELPAVAPPSAPIPGPDAEQYVFPREMFSFQAPLSPTSSTSDTCPPSMSPIPQWNELLAGLRKIPSPAPSNMSAEESEPVAKAPPKKSCTKKVKASNPSDSGDHDDSGSTGRGKRTRKGAPSKEVVALTVDENGRRINDAYGNRVELNVPAKRKGGKENVNARRAKKVKT